jgi:pimeloyl-ACP methyl ester carboxylesterase
VHFIDEGDPGWTPLLFLGGAGTSVRAFGLMEFARTLREQLRVRVVSVERNGLGQTPFDPAVGLREYAAGVWALLDELDIPAVSIVAVSGGGPYAANVAAMAPDRVRSLHLACTWSERLDDVGLDVSVPDVARDPVAWWRFPQDSPVHRIPGFVDSTVEEATRASFALGDETEPRGLEQAFAFYRDAVLPDLSSIVAPAFLYWGDDDRVVPLTHLRRWQSALPNVCHVRLYPNEAHDVQYRHWDQVLADVAHLGDRVVVCVDGRSHLVEPEHVPKVIANGGTLGLSAWVCTAATRSVTCHAARPVIRSHLGGRNRPE